MNPRQLKWYLSFSLLHVLFTACWTLIFAQRFPNPIFSGVATVLFAQLFFWFAFGAPRISFAIAREKGKLSEHMQRVKWIVFGWFACFAIGSLWMLIQPLFTGKPETLMFFTIPLALALGAYGTWKLIVNTLNKEQS